MRGIASIEAVLFLPVFLVLILMLVHITKMMLIKQQVINEARLEGWSQSYGIKSSVLAGISKIIGGDGISTSSKRQKPNKQKDLLTTIRKEGETKYYQGHDKKRAYNASTLTQVMKNTDSTVLIAKASTAYTAHSKLEGWSFDITDQHAVVANRIWERSMLPIGYDNYMKQRLNSRVFFPRYLPCAKGAPSSAKKQC